MASHASFHEANSGVFHGGHYVIYLIYYGVQCGSYDMVSAYTTGKSANYTLCVGLPVRSTKTGKGRYYVATVGIVYL